MRPLLKRDTVFAGLAPRAASKLNDKYDLHMQCLAASLAPSWPRPLLKLSNLEQIQIRVSRKMG
jgi:hypothetical protein